MKNGISIKNKNRHRKFFFYSSIIFSCLYSNCAPSGSIIVSRNLLETRVKCNIEDINSGSDTYFPDQWYLKNTGQSGGVPGEDINIGSTWSSGNLGQGTRIIFLDEGLDSYHEDLSGNIIDFLNYNIVNQSQDPFSANENHGTSVAGIAAARGFNGIGTRGVAPCAGIAAINLLEENTLNNRLDSIVKNIELIDISNNSWGANDLLGDFNDFYGNTSWREAIQHGLNNGRSGKGSLFIFSAGNGAFRSGYSVDIDNSNYDSLTNFYGVITVCGLTDTGQKATFSEQGANLLVCGFAASAADNTRITATDQSMVGKGLNLNGGGFDYADFKYTKRFQGTSAAAPQISGAVALMLSANPNLNWRDVIYILAKTARNKTSNPFPLDIADGDWVQNNGGTGYWVNHKYGFGAINVTAAVNMASSNYTNLGSLLKETTVNDIVNLSIPQNNDLNSGITRTISISGSTISKIEYVGIEVNLTHTSAGDLDIEIESPAGTKSRLANYHPCFNGSGFQIKCLFFSTTKTWNFGSRRHLDENPNGTWTLRMVDRNNVSTGSLNYVFDSDTGSIHYWKLNIWGREN